MLDAFGDKEFFQTKKEYQEYFDRYRELRKAVLEKQKNEQEHKARIEMLAFQIAEIEAVSLKSGEDLALMKERDKLLNHKQIADTLTNAYVMLDNEDFSSLSNVRSAMNDLQSLEEYDSDYKELSGNLSEAYYVLEDVTKQLGDLLDNLDFDAGRLQEIEHRLDTINAITRKYGGTVDDVLDYLENSSKEYNLLTGNSSSSDAMEQELKQLEKDLLASAETLQTARHQIATALLKLRLRTSYATFTWIRLILKLPLLKGNLTVMAMSRLSFTSQPIQVKALNRLLRLLQEENYLDSC